MNLKKQITVGLLSHYFQDSNLGCTALSICNVLMIDKAAERLGMSVKYVILSNEKQPQVPLTFTKSEYEYRVFPSTKKVLKNPISLITTKVFDGCDVVFNLCAGDGFTDIYGKWRTFSETYMTITGYKKGHKMVLSPQTIGPFNNFFCRWLGRYAMNCCTHIFVRDNLSYELCCKLGQSEKTTEYVDVALALPFKKVELEHDKFNLGINVSGLLYNSASNSFGLNFDYKEFIHKLVEMGLEKGYRVHLISHVIIPDEKGEDDFHACKIVHDKYPETVLAPVYMSPIDIKGYIAGLDLFTGARMHATIGSISSGVPVVPVAYSRKVNGLYGNLKYPYYIDARSEGMNVETAVDTIGKYIENVPDLRKNVEISKEIYTKSLDLYTRELESILENCV